MHCQEDDPYRKELYLQFLDLKEKKKKRRWEKKTQGIHFNEKPQNGPLSNCSRLDSNENKML